MKKNKNRKSLKIFVFFYVLMGLFVAYIGGTTRETIEKIGTQKIKDKVIEIKRVIRDSMNNLYICYIGDRGEETNIENWIAINLDQFFEEITRYYVVNPRNSYLHSCSNTPLKIKGGLKIETKEVKLNIYKDYFLYQYPKYDEITEKIYFVKESKYLDFGYVKNNYQSNDEIAFKIYTPDVEISGDKTQILFLPFALAIDIVAWPYRLSKLLNSSHM